MARTPAAQGFGIVGNGDWRGILMENGQVVVLPALVKTKYQK
jgi:hypothetical protein